MGGPEYVLQFLKKIQRTGRSALERLSSKLNARSAGLFVGLSALFLFLSARPAQALVLNWIAFGISWLISMLFAIAIALEAWILGFILQINTGIVNSPPVAVGFPISLSIANLFFVLAIVVIAIATILRLQSYGIKQALWRLVVMAVAVNFGLIIAGGILQFSDSLSGYFLNAVDPTGGSSNGVVNTAKFASAIAGAFQPQQQALLNVSGSSSSGAGGWLSTLKDAWNFVTGDVASFIGAEFLQPIAMLVFTIFFLLFMVIVLGVLIVMLIIRYVYLGYLLILLPLAWAAWIFPATRGQWTKWWTSFIKQTFFAPIVLFFMWVAIQVSYQMSSLNAYNISQYRSPSNPVWGGIAEIFTNLFAGTFQQFLQLTVILGVMLGGIFAAQSMSIKFADAGVKAATGTAKSFGGWAAMKGKQFGTAPLRSERGKEIAKRLQQTQRRVPLLGMIPGVNRLATMGASYAGGALQKMGVAGAESAVETAGADLKNLTPAQKANMLTRVSAPVRMAILKQLHESGDMGLVRDLDKYLGKDQEALFNRYNMKEFFGEARGKWGLSIKEKVDELKALGKTRDEIHAEIAKLIQTAKDPKFLAKTFMIDQKKFDETKPLGIASHTDFQDYQSYVMAGMALGASGSALSAFYGESARGDQLEIAKQAMTRAGITQRDLAAKNQVALNWYQNTTARNLGLDLNSAGIA